jgi:hypothetical protein
MSNCIDATPKSRNITQATLASGQPLKFGTVFGTRTNSTSTNAKLKR